MGRVAMWATLVLLAVFVLSATFFIDHGGESIAQVQEVTVHDLSSIPPTYVGAHITTTGTLAFSEEHDRYQVDGDANTTVVIREYDGHRDLQDLVGREVRVNGTFGFEEDFGTYIDADTIEPAAND